MCAANLLDIAGSLCHFVSATPCVDKEFKSAAKCRMVFLKKNRALLGVETLLDAVCDCVRSPPSPPPDCGVSPSREDGWCRVDVTQYCCPALCTSAARCTSLTSVPITPFHFYIYLLLYHWNFHSSFGERLPGSPTRYSMKNCEIIILVSLCTWQSLLLVLTQPLTRDCPPPTPPLHSGPGEKREIVRRRGVIFTFSRDQVRCWLQNIIPEWTLPIVSCHGTVSMWAVDPGQWSPDVEWVWWEHAPSRPLTGHNGGNEGAHWKLTIHYNFYPVAVEQGMVGGSALSTPGWLQGAVSVWCQYVPIFPHCTTAELELGHEPGAAFYVLMPTCCSHLVTITGPRDVGSL